MPANVGLPFVGGRPLAHDRYFQVPAGCAFSRITIRVEWDRGADLDLSVIEPRPDGTRGGTWTNADDNGADAFVVGGFEQLVFTTVPHGEWMTRIFGPRSAGVDYTGTVTVVRE